jgi:DNA-binding MarR family transcriptional regulator
MLVERKDDFSGEPQQIVGKLTSENNPLFSRYRLAIMLELYASGATEFLQFKHDLGLDDGALKTHLRVLLKAGWISASKELRVPGGRRKHTTYTLTPDGFAGIESFSGLLNIINRDFFQKAGINAR